MLCGGGGVVEGSREEDVSLVSGEWFPGVVFSPGVFSWSALVAFAFRSSLESCALLLDVLVKCDLQDPSVACILLLLFLFLLLGACFFVVSGGSACQSEYSSLSSSGLLKLVFFCLLTGTPFFFLLHSLVLWVLAMLR